MAETFKNAKAKIQATNTTVYTVPSATTAIVLQAQVANVSATSEEVTVFWEDTSDSSAVTRFVKDLVVPAGVAVGVLDGKLVLEAGDIIKAIGEDNDDAEITVSVLEIS
jgi:hypothetical protein